MNIQEIKKRLNDDEVFTYTDNSSGQLRHIKTVNESACMMISCK